MPRNCAWRAEARGRCAQVERSALHQVASARRPTTDYHQGVRLRFVHASTLAALLAVVASACEIPAPVDVVARDASDIVGDGASGVCQGPGCPIAVALALNADSTCARMGDDTTRCWGAFPDTRLPRQQYLLSGTSALTLGDGYLCARMPDATVRCFGDNAAGQLGDGTMVARTVPSRVTSLTNAIQVIAAGTTTCAVTSDHALWCWGSNAQGQFGDSTTQGRITPYRITGVPNVARLAMNRESACAVITDGTVRCWGGGFTNIPTLVPGLSGVSALTMGNAHYCALLADHTAKCWGANAYGQLGEGSTTPRTVPVPVNDLTGAVRLVTGATHTCAVIDDGTVRCWGQNDVGQLGDGSTSGRMTPTRVPGIDQVVELEIGLATSAGSGHTCVVRRDGSAWCWGHNIAGQLGDGTTMYRTSPVRVVF